MAKTCKNKKVAETNDVPPVSPVVLVGTYRPENAEWIKAKRLYNLPLPDGGDAKAYEKFNAIVLYANDAAPIAYAAKVSQVVDKVWLKVA